MSDEHQEQSAASTTELGESNGSLGIGYNPDDASNYAKEVNALLYADENATTETEEESPEEEAIEEAQEEEATTEETEEESEDTEEEEQPKAARYRIKAKNDVERTALALHKANPDWTLEQSIDAAKKLHPETATETHEEAESESVSLDTIDAQITELQEKRKNAIKEFDADLQIEIEDQLDALKDQKSNLALKQQEREITEEQAFYADADRYAKEAVALYPDSANPNSALAKEMARIDADLIASDNPLIYDPKKAFRVAQMAANNLAIAPRSQTKPVTVKKTTTRPAFQPSSGQTRSTSAAAPVLDALAKDDMTLSEYEAIVGQIS
jgi:hypothetical protein